MAKMTPAQWRQYAAQWQRASPELERVHREELAHWKYDARIVDALLDIGAKSPRKEEEPNGLVEMQKWFMKFARKQGLLPVVVREESVPYGKPLLRTFGDASIPPGPKLALLCSVKCPGKLILETYDLVQHLRNIGVIVISGFHSPMEQECLRILLRSPHPVIWCFARGLLKTIPAEFRAAVAENRLVIVSPFPDKLRRVTAEAALVRNRLVADMASAVVVAHAAPGSKIEALCRDLLSAGKALYAFDHPANSALIQSGARPITPETDWLHVMQGSAPYAATV